MMPLHRWLPAAMVAPTPVSALLHAVAVVYSGVYGIVRVAYSVFGHELMRQLSLSRILPWVAAFTILAGVIIATRQDVLKRRLAYHTISQLSYILLGAFTLCPWGLAGAMLHMISYSTLKITLFFGAGTIAKQTGKVNIVRWGGIGWQLPLTLSSSALPVWDDRDAASNTLEQLTTDERQCSHGEMAAGISVVGSGMINALVLHPHGGICLCRNTGSASC